MQLHFGIFCLYSYDLDAQVADLFQNVFLFRVAVGNENVKEAQISNVRKGDFADFGLGEFVTKIVGGRKSGSSRSSGQTRSPASSMRCPLVLVL